MPSDSNHSFEHSCQIWRKTHDFWTFYMRAPIIFYFGASTEKCCFQKNHVRFLTIDAFFSLLFWKLNSIIIFQRSRSSLCTSGGGGGDFDGIWPIVPLWTFKPLFCRVRSWAGKKQLKRKNMDAKCENLILLWAWSNVAEGIWHKFFSFDTKPVSLLPRVGKWLFLVSVGILFCIISQRHKLLAKSHRYFVAKSSENRLGSFLCVQACGSVFFFFS